MECRDKECEDLQMWHILQSYRSGIARLPRRGHTFKCETGGAVDQVEGSICVLIYLQLETSIYYYTMLMILYINKSN
jgi:hypothetical protein